MKRAKRRVAINMVIFNIVACLAVIGLSAVTFFIWENCTNWSDKGLVALIFFVDLPISMYIIGVADEMAKSYKKNALSKIRRIEILKRIKEEDGNDSL